MKGRPDEENERQSGVIFRKRSEAGLEATVQEPQPATADEPLMRDNQLAVWKMWLFTTGAEPIALSQRWRCKR